MSARPVADTETAQRILDASLQLFARQGFRATSIKQIGAAAQCNTALIHYYFDHKENLYKAVLRHVLDQVITGIGGAFTGDESPEDAIRGFVRAQARLMRAHPEFLQLMLREMSDWGARHAEDEIHTLGATTFRKLRGFIESGQKTGIFRPDIDARFAALSIAAQVNWMVVARPAVGVLLGRGLGRATDADLDAFASHAAELILAGLRSPTPPRARPIRQKTKRQKV